MHADSTDKVAVDSTKFPREQFYHSRTHSYLRNRQTSAFHILYNVHTLFGLLMLRNENYL